MKRIAAVNDFVIKFANVNGSGSASANELFAKAVMRMGVPVSPRNIFPSNIQGMPTWYEARVCEKGYHGRRGGVDMMVAMNPQTWDTDLAEIESGGYLFYDSTRPLPPNKFRDDVLTIGVPLTEIANAAYSEPRQRQLFKNIIYVGALSPCWTWRPRCSRSCLQSSTRARSACWHPMCRLCIWDAITSRRTWPTRWASACSGLTRWVTRSLPMAPVPPA